MKTLYQHPDGMGRISFDQATMRLRVTNEANGTTSSALIGPDGLADLAADLLALAADMGELHHD